MESDLSLINKVKEDQDERSLTELINRHSGIYIQTVDRFAVKSPLDRTAIMEDKDLEIYRAALNYDPSKNTKFSTFLANTAKWKCLNLLNKMKKKPEVSYENMPERVGMATSDFSDTIRKTEAWTVFSEALEQESDERVKKIIDIRYNADNNKLVPWRVVADQLNMSIQGCINLHNRFIETVKKQLKNA